jgi:hypothetical protein
LPSRSGEPITFRGGDGRPIDRILSRWSFNTLTVIGVRPERGRDFVAADQVPGGALGLFWGYPLIERLF